jgi:hypothetical protein
MEWLAGCGRYSVADLESFLLLVISESVPVVKG